MELSRSGGLEEIPAVAIIVGEYGDLPIAFAPGLFGKIYTATFHLLEICVEVVGLQEKSDPASTLGADAFFLRWGSGFREQQTGS